MIKNSEVLNITDDSVCEGCGNSALMCACEHRVFFFTNKLRDTIQAPQTLANVKTRDGNIMMTREQFHALMRYANLNCNIPVSSMATKKVESLLKCFANP